MDEFEHRSVESKPSQKATRRQEIVVRAGKILEYAKPKLQRFVVAARPRAQAVGQGAVRYVREHDVEIRTAAATVARYRLRGPVGLMVGALLGSGVEARRSNACPRCGTMNIRLAKFCNECGSNLDGRQPRQL